MNINCPHLNNRRCKWLSNRIGIPMPVTSVFCKFTCSKLGPYCGNKINKKTETEFLAEAFVSRYCSLPMKDGFICRVVQAYKRGMKIHVPKEWSIIKKNLKFLYEKYNFVTNICLTGSLIVKDVKTFKDYDILITVKDYNCVDKNFISQLPSKINNINCDYFFTNNHNCYMFFISLDCDKRKLYTVNWFDPKLEDVEEGIEIVREPVINGFVIEHIEKILKKRYNYII